MAAESGIGVEAVESWSLAKSNNEGRNSTTLVFPQTKLEKWLLTWCDTSYYDGRPKTLLRGLTHELAFLSLPFWSWYPRLSTPHGVPLSLRAALLHVEPGHFSPGLLCRPTNAFS
jgi:hypothetical protein